MLTPFKHHVPIDLIENLRWRKRLQERVMEDLAYADILRQTCVQDPIFFVNAVCYTYDPRRKPFPKVPFILYDFQESAFLDILDAINDHDLLIEKSRDMGASWLCDAAFFWCWMFRPMQSFLIGSRVDELVDATGNPKSLFWKLDFLLDNLPTWLKPIGFNKHDHRIKRHLENPENNSVIDGETTTKDFGRGDRRTAILLDEFAMVQYFGSHICESTRPVTNCRLFNSTPNGVANAFYAMRQTNIKRLTLHWHLHPDKAVGLYTRRNNVFIALDKAYWLKFDDPGAEMARLDALILGKNVPLPDGKKRSLWYATECDRAQTAREIAKEIDIDYEGSGGQWFNADRVEEAIALCATAPMVVGDLEYDEISGDPIRFREDPKGFTKLWVMLDGKGDPIVGHNRIILGVDVSAGTGASNSCLVAYDSVTHEKILEIASPYIRPEAFALLCVAVGRWFKKVAGIWPFMIWEANGPGRQFGAKVQELGYGSIYLRRNDVTITKRVSDIPGWAPTKEGKLVLLGEYRNAVEGGKVANYSRCALEETLEYVHLPNGGVGHARAQNKMDPSGAASNHGDRVMADALAWKGLGDFRRRPTPVKPEVPIGSLAWRQKVREGSKSRHTGELNKGWAA